MKKMIINGVGFCNFGSNNITYGMELISCYPMPPRMIQDVLAGKYPGVFLNPSITCTEEFYGFFGTEDQYKKVYKRQKEAIIAKDLIYYLNQWGTDIHKCEDSEYYKAKELAEQNYEDWWQIFKEQP